MTGSRESFWLRQVRALLDAERSGADPASLERNWLLLASMTWEDRRPIGIDLPDHVYHVFDDADVRSKDRGYAERQWSILEEWLRGRHL